MKNQKYDFKVIYCSGENRNGKSYEILKLNADVFGNGEYGNGWTWHKKGSWATAWRVFNAVGRYKERIVFDSEAAEFFKNYLAMNRGRRQKQFVKKGLELNVDFVTPPRFDVFEPEVEEARRGIEERRLELLDVYG